MALAPLLQIRQIRRHRSSRSVSVAYQQVLLVGFVLWLAYGIADTNLALIVPNTLVYNRHDSTEQDRILLARSFDLDCRNGVLYADIECDVITDDESTFGFARVCLSIPKFAGARKIQELAVYPLD